MKLTSPATLSKGLAQNLTHSKHFRMLLVLFLLLASLSLFHMGKNGTIGPTLSSSQAYGEVKWDHE